jgi:hypothetical protein
MVLKIPTGSIATGNLEMYSRIKNYKNWLSTPITTDEPLMDPKESLIGVLQRTTNNKQQSMKRQQHLS